MHACPLGSTCHTTQPSRSLPSTPGGADAASPATRGRCAPPSDRKQPVSPVRPLTSPQTPPVAAQSKPVPYVSGEGWKHRKIDVLYCKIVSKTVSRIRGRRRAERLLKNYNTMACVRQRGPSVSEYAGGESHARLPRVACRDTRRLCAR